MGARGLPLTLALSPQAGRGDVPRLGAERAARVLLSVCGEKVAAGG